jgi:hypothetical protein
VHADVRHDVAYGHVVNNDTSFSEKFLLILYTCDMHPGVDSVNQAGWANIIYVNMFPQMKTQQYELRRTMGRFHQQEHYSFIYLG